MELFGLRDKDGKEYKLQVEQYRHGYTLSCFAAVFDLEPTKKYDSDYKIGQWVKFRIYDGSDNALIVVKHIPPDALRLLGVTTRKYYWEKENFLQPMSQEEIEKCLLNLGKP